MNNTRTRMWVHLLFSTKHCRPLMFPPVVDEISSHLKNLLKEMGCKPRMVAAMPDHVHLLFVANHTMNTSDIVKQLKGNSSHWINDHDLVRSKFVWEKGYTAVSENDAGAEELVRMMKDHEEYHKTKSFLQEVDEVIGRHTVVGATWEDLEENFL